MSTTDRGGGAAASPRKATAARSWPLFASLQGYRFGFVSHDVVAGLTLAAIAIPEQMATARLGGFPPEVGFFAFVAGALAFAAFGGSRFLSCGADSTITPIFAGGCGAWHRRGAGSAAAAVELALMVGVVMVLGGLFRLGWIADLLSVPVTTGFLAGIAAHILISQLPEILGLPAPDGQCCSDSTPSSCIWVPPIPMRSRSGSACSRSSWFRSGWTPAFPAP